MAADPITILNATEMSSRQLLSEFFASLGPVRPLAEFVLSIATLYVIYLIIRIIFGYINLKRIKNIDKNTKEILSILKCKKKEKVR